MSKGSKRRPGTGYEDNYDKIFKSKQQSDEEFNEWVEAMESGLMELDDITLEGDEDDQDQTQ